MCHNKLAHFGKGWVLICSAINGASLACPTLKKFVYSLHNRRRSWKKIGFGFG